MKKIKVRNPIYGFENRSIEDAIDAGQLYELKYVEGEGIVND